MTLIPSELPRPLCISLLRKVVPHLLRKQSPSIYGIVTTSRLRLCPSPVCGVFISIHLKGQRFYLSQLVVHSIHA